MYAVWHKRKNSVAKSLLMIQKIAQGSILHSAVLIAKNETKTHIPIFETKILT